jgi:hypothetical protein
VYIFGNLIGMVWVLTVPLLRLLNESRVILWISIFFLFNIKAVLYQCCYLSVFVMINNSVKKKNLGKLNGISQSLVALTRGTGPSLGFFLK